MEEGPGLYKNRELSWLEFNGRVLEEAERAATPLGEKLSFLSIYQNNLDEFFMVRVGALLDRMELDGARREGKTGMTPEEELCAIFARVRALERRKDRAYAQGMDALARYGVRVWGPSAPTPGLAEWFEREAAPALSPVVVREGDPFPFLQGGMIYAAGALETPQGERALGLVPCAAGVLPRLVPWGRGRALLEELILRCLSRLFPGYRARERGLVRLTRSADLDADFLYDEELDYRDFVEELVEKRRRLSPVRLVLSLGTGKFLAEELARRLDLPRRGIFRSASPLDLSFLPLSFLPRLRDALAEAPELFYPPYVPQNSSGFRRDRPLLSQVRERDRLLCYPYDSMEPFLDLLDEAAADPAVLSIRMTLYRAAPDGRVARALMAAAGRGKDVLALVELKARFDEERNVRLSRRLEEAGCRVVHGVSGRKIHAKLCLITRREEGGELEYYTQVGTGNYNERTSRQYADFSLLTAEAGLGREVEGIFEALARGATPTTTGELLTAPQGLEEGLLELMDTEIARARAGEGGYIGGKLNALTDKVLMEKLAEASQAGVKVELVVRGICCLVPGVPGRTENITVRSVVGRFLEHSRLYVFGREGRERVYLSSADWMTRNIRRRVEAAVPIHSAEVRERLLSMFRALLRDDRQARELGADGVYRPTARGAGVNAQELFLQTRKPAVPNGSSANAETQPFGP